MIEHGDSIRAVKYTGSWQAIKYPWDILSVMDYFSGKISSDIAPSASIAPSATIEDNVIIAGGARIMENAVVRGPCYIGHNSIIGNDTLIRGGSHIGDDCVVGHATEIKHSYIGDGCWFHQNYCGDSVVGYHCSFGAGTVTGNLRLDDRNITVMVGKEIVDTNTNKLVSIMPGVRIGANSFVGPHLCLDNDLPENRMARAVTPGYEVVDSTAISEKR
jgi:bifunctional UDP-N-acetylglucosamine pyrophosphorylase/glucosamine-1-phosphate N-acetyltransferase